MTSFAYRLGAGTRKVQNVAIAGTVVAAAGMVHGAKVAGKATGQFGVEFAQGYVAQGGFRDQLNSWFAPKAPEAHREQPKQRMWDVNGKVVD